MALRPNVPYSGVPDVLPQVQQPNDYVRAEATPADFGGQIGAALQQGGQTGERVGTQATDLAIQQQGMINESLATNAETGYITKLSSLTDAYRTSSGLDAINGLPDVQQKIAALRQQTLASLPTGGAQRAFAMLAQRHEAYALSDVASYHAQQVKAFDATTANDSATLAATRSGALDVAQDDARFHDNLQTINFQIARIMQNQGYGTAMTQDPNTGELSFPSTPQGQAAQAFYEKQRDSYMGAAWENRIHALADDPAHGNVVTANQVFEKNRADIPPEAQMRIAAYLQPKMRTFQANAAAGNALSAADDTYRTTVSDVVRTGALKITPDQMTGAIYAQESSSGANAATSVTGARGGMQIEPATFQQYARPGESINSAADNMAVGKRIIAGYMQKYDGDPQRVAVAYFSGPGNVAPPGSPTPWIKDVADPTGKTTSSYVSDVTGRLAGQDGLISKADFYKQHYADIIQATRERATEQFPDDPQAADLAAARTEQQLNATIRQQELAYHADNDLVFQAMNGDLAKGTRPTTIDQLIATSPAVKAAWDRMQYQQPQAAREIATRILSENARTNGSDARTYGPAYRQVFNAINAPAGTPGRITTDTQLYSLVGQPNGLTMAGLAMARRELLGKNTPEGEAESVMRAEMFKVAHQALTGTNDSIGIKDPKGEEIYLRWVASAYKAIDAAKADGKTPQQIYDPASPDYIGKTIGAFKRNDAQKFADTISENTTTDNNVAPAPSHGWFSGLFGGNAPDLSTPEKIRTAYLLRLIDRDTAIKKLVGMAHPGPSPADIAAQVPH